MTDIKSVTTTEGRKYITRLIPPARYPTVLAIDEAYDVGKRLQEFAKIAEADKVRATGDDYDVVMETPGNYRGL